MEVIAYTREGFEKEAAAEIVEKLSAASLSCYANLNGLKGLARVIFSTQWQQASKILSLDGLIFSRQLLFCDSKLEKLDENDRIEPLIDSLSATDGRNIQRCLF